MNILQQVSLARPVLSLDHEHVALAASEFRKRTIEHGNRLLAAEGE